MAIKKIVDNLLVKIVATFICIFTFSTTLSSQVSIWDGTSTPFSNGTGTESDPYLIESAQHLAYLAYLVNYGIGANNNKIVGVDTHYKMTIDINLCNRQWIAIGYYNSTMNHYYFGGHFDGNGHTIDSVNCRSNGANFGQKYRGFFGTVNGGSVKNVGIIGNTDYGTGALIAYCTGNVIIENSFTINTGNISSGNGIQGDLYEAFSGGIVGYNSGDLTINNSFNEGKIYSHGLNVEHQAASYSYAYAGGIVGCNTGTLAINNCYHSGDVSSLIADHQQFSRAHSGGIVGRNTGILTIKDCYNTGTVYAKSSRIRSSPVSSESHSGGIVGHNATYNSIINNSYNTGDISAFYHSYTNSNNYTFTTSSYAGGITGYRSSGRVDISNSYNVGAATYAIIGNGGSSIVSNTYYLNTCSNNSTNGIPKTEIFMKTQEFVDLLNLHDYAFRMDTAPNLNNNYPIHSGIKALIELQEISDITQNSALLKAIFSSKNLTILQKGFQYKKNNEFTYTSIEVNTSDNSLMHTLLDLSHQTDYICRAYVITEEIDTIFSNEHTFTTLSYDFEITTPEVSGIAQTTAELKAFFYSNTLTLLQKGFQYKKNNNSAYTSIEVNTQGDSLMHTLLDLSHQTDYICRAYVITEEIDTIFSNEHTFTTLSYDFEITTPEVSGIAQTTAELKAFFYSNTLTLLQKGFQYKKNNNSAYTSIEVNTQGDSLMHTLLDLSHQTDYICRAYVITEEIDTVFSTEHTFTTLSYDFEITTPEVSGIAQTTAELKAFFYSNTLTLLQKGFQYKKNNASAYTSIEVNTQGDSLIHTLLDLSHQTDYICRAYIITEEIDTVFSNEHIFTTLPYDFEITTPEVSGIAQTTAELKAFFYSNTLTLLQKGFQYKKNNESDYISIEVNTSGDSLMHTLLDLNHQTEYICRAYVITEEIDTIFSNEHTFTTLPYDFEIEILEASTITQTSAELKAKFSSNTLTLLEKGFQYKTANTHNYTSVEVNTQGDSLLYTLNGLIQQTEYLYRVYILTEEIDTIFSNEHSFATISLGIENPKDNEMITLYPNPTKNSFFIHCNDISSIKIYDMSGKEILNQIVNAKTEINISHLPIGIYNINIFSKDKFIGNCKIIKD